MEPKTQRIESRTALDAQYERDLERFKDGEPPRPDYWGGYWIVPTRIEFWKGRTSRMHNRIEFVRSVGADGSYGDWSIQRLQP